MEDSFRVRVDKIFGSLNCNTGSNAEATQSPEGVNPSLWCLTDEEVEKRQWNRKFNQEVDDENEDNESGPVVLRDPLESDLLELSEGDEDEEEEEEGGDGDEKNKRCRIDDDDFDVESNIGRDSTLDLEEEEDENDKLAVGIQEKNGDALYVKDATFADYGIDEEVITSGELPDSFYTLPRDDRADIAAAKLRLKEDDAQFSEDPDTSQTMETEDDVKKQPLDHEIPKSILKKPVISIESRSQKRVRFFTDTTSSSTSEVGIDSPSKLSIEKPVSELPENSSGVPDYVINPTKYTRYDFDSSEDISDQSNSKALNDLFQFLRKSSEESSSVDDTPADLSKPVMFTPKVKRGEKSDMEEDSDLKNKGWSVDLTVEGTEEYEAMEEDEPNLQVGSLQKLGRKYRARTSTDADDN